VCDELNGLLFGWSSFLITSTKRLLQQNLPIPDLSGCSKLTKLLDHLVGAG
jgi:hypothetical protein